MKLASIPDGTRDGRLVVVSRDLTRCADAERIAPTLQHALDHWDQVAPELEALARTLEAGAIWAERFRERSALSPLPRAFQWLDGSAYPGHAELLRRARGAELPDNLRSEPLMYQGGSDGFLPPRADIEVADPAWGPDLEAEIAVVTGDVPRGADRAAAAAAIRLVMLANDVSLRGLTGTEAARGFGFVQSKPAGSFSPVAVTPDELGDAWDGARLSGLLAVDLNGEPLGRAQAEDGSSFDFPALIAHAARTRALAAGTIIGSGTVSNPAEDGGPGRTVAEGGRGFSCLAELRTVETIREGAPRTPFLQDGDEVRIEMRDARGQSIFGAIEQVVRVG
ncbi:MAG TPA: fumarylacetoacetate hydrolase family protein [Paracoccaceae bacterium]|nr:fumarylacetoacetate hydrolase family protein [Paracoccaceae bacterium]